MITTVKRKPTGRQFGLGNIDKRLEEIRNAIDPSVGRDNIIKIFLIGYLEQLSISLSFVAERNYTGFNKLSQAILKLFVYQKGQEFVKSIPGSVQDPFEGSVSFKQAFENVFKAFPRPKSIPDGYPRDEIISERITLIQNVEETLFNSSISIRQGAETARGSFIPEQDFLAATIPAGIQTPISLENKLTEGTLEQVQPLLHAISQIEAALTAENLDLNEITTQLAALQDKLAEHDTLFALEPAQNACAPFNEGDNTPAGRCQRLNTLQDLRRLIIEHFASNQ